MGGGLSMILVAYGALACTETGAMTQPWMPVSEQQEDLDQLQSWIERDRSFPPAPGLRPASDSVSSSIPEGSTPRRSSTSQWPG